MPEFRQNFVTKEWVIVAPERGRRPNDRKETRPARPPLPAYRADCPFCPGHEDRTPEPTYMWESAGAWQVRVVPNKFAALRAEQPTERERVGPFLRAGGFGLAEVVIESPHHDRTLETLAAPEVEQVLRAFRSRHLAMASDPRINLVTVFRNYGPLAGTSLEHPHSQIIATPIVPPHVRDPWRHAQLHYDTHGRCAYCEMLEGELIQQVRVIRETEHFVAFAPFASKTPYELRILPKRHHASFSWINDREIRDLAPLLRETLLRLRVALEAPDYNLVIRSAASGDEDVRHLHWYLIVIPRITTPAGFEIGSGIYINIVAPESAAETLRSTALLD